MPLHEDEKGLALRFRFIRDGAVAAVRDASVKEIWAKKPGGTWTLYTATFTDEVEDDGIIQHVFTALEQDTPGVWQAQGFVEVGGWSKWSDVETFNVFRNKTT